MKATKATVRFWPLFVENVGQFDSRVLFQTLGSGPRLLLAQDSIWLTVVEPPRAGPDLLRTHDMQPGNRPLPVRAVHVRLSFVGASFVMRPKPHGKHPARVSYLKGANPALWRPAVPVWTGVTYEDIYPGLSLSLSGERGRLAWRLESRSGAALRQVRLRIEGCEGVTLRPSVENPDLRNPAALALLTAVGHVNLPLIALEGGGPMRPRVEEKRPSDFEVANPFTRAGSRARRTN